MNKTTMEAAVEWVRWASLIPGGPDIEFAEKFAALVQGEANKGRLATDTQTDREQSVGEASSAPLLPTPPDAEAVARETLAWLASYDQQTTRTDEQQCLSHAAACVRFVAALDAMDRGDSGDSLQYDGMAQGWYYQPVRGGVYFGKTRYAAFRAAQDHPGGGDA